MGKGGWILASSKQHADMAVSRAAAEYLYSHFPGLEEKLSIDEYLAERTVKQEERFRRVEPMAGAFDLVRHLVSRLEPSLAPILMAV